MSLWLDSRPLHGRRQGGSGERLPQGRLVDVHARWKREQRNKHKPRTETRTTPSNQTCQRLWWWPSWLNIFLRKPSRRCKHVKIEAVHSTSIPTSWTQFCVHQARAMSSSKRPFLPVNFICYGLTRRSVSQTHQLWPRTKHVLESPGKRGAARPKLALWFRNQEAMAAYAKTNGIRDTSLYGRWKIGRPAD